MTGRTGVFNIVMLVVFIAMIYLMLIRPQRKHDKELKNLRESLKPGDEVITVGGIVGKVVRVKESSVVIETGAAKTKLEMTKTAIGSIVKAGPGAESEDKKEETEEPKQLSRDRKVTPKKLGGKSKDDKKVEDKAADVEPAAEETSQEA